MEYKEATQLDYYSNESLFILATAELKAWKESIEELEELVKEVAEND